MGRNAAERGGIFVGALGRFGRGIGGAAERRRFEGAGRETGALRR